MVDEASHVRPLDIAIPLSIQFFKELVVLSICGHWLFLLLKNKVKKLHGVFLAETSCLIVVELVPYFVNNETHFNLLLMHLHALSQEIGHLVLRNLAVSVLIKLNVEPVKHLSCYIWLALIMKIRV